MKTKNQLPRLLFVILMAALLFVPLAGTNAVYAAEGIPGAVYVLSNEPGGNAVIAYDRFADGRLADQGIRYSTGGLGTGSGLGSQGAIALSQDNRWLFAVNAGSNDVSVFAVQPQGLALVDKVASGGIQPISLTAYKDLLYVLNAGGSGNISGFQIGSDGKLAPIPGSTRPLSNNGVGASPGPAQVSFSPDGNALVVTEKATNQIDVYAVDSMGAASGPTIYASAGATPFGFGFGHNGVLIVSEAFGGAPDASATSSYQLAGTSLQVVSASALTHQTAACWIAVTQNGKYAYAANAGSSSVSGYQVGPDGILTLLNTDGRTGVTGPGSAPVDMALSHNSQYLYVLSARSQRIYAFSVNADGSLTPAGEAMVPVQTGVTGIAAW